MMKKQRLFPSVKNQKKLKNISYESNEKMSEFLNKMWMMMALKLRKLIAVQIRNNNKKVIIIHI